MNDNQRRDRFKRLGESRTNTVIKKIQVLSNCSNKSMYQYTPDEVSKIFKAIEDELRTAKAKFKFRTKKGDKQFKLD